VVEALPETWDEVARHYSPEIGAAERDLAGEIAKLIEGAGLPPPTRLIEVGAGSGHLSLILQERGYDTTLLDFSRVALDHARAIYDAHGYGDEANRTRFILGDALNLTSITSDGFDLAWNSGVAEHFDAERLEHMLRGMASLARNVLIIVPNPESLFYLAGRRRLTIENRWIYGVELLRRNYADVFQAAGLSRVRHGFLGSAMTRDWIRLAVGTDAAPIVETLLDEGQLPSREFYLEYFIGEVEKDPVPQTDPARPRTNMDRDVFDRTLAIDALGTAMVSLSKTQQELDNVKKKAIDLKELQLRMQHGLEALASHYKALEENRERDRRAAETNREREILDRLQAAWSGWESAYAAACRLREACDVWRRRALAVEASRSWRITAPLRALQLMRRGLTVAPSFAPLETPELPAHPSLVSVSGAPTTLRESTMLEPQIEAVRQRLASGLRSGLTIVTCGFDFDITVNQRPINLAREAVATGHSVIFVAWEWSPDQPSAFRNQLFEGDILQVGRFDFIARAELFADLVRAADESIYVLSVPSRDLCDAQHALRSAGCTVVYDIMDDWEHFALVGQAAWFERQAEENAVLSADVVTAVSPPLAAKFGSLRRDIEIVPNGFSPRVLGRRPSSRNLANQEKITKVGYFGHLTESWFDWPIVFETLEAFRDIKMDIIGYGEPDWVRKRATGQPRLRLIGKVLPSQLAQHAANWHVAMIPFKGGRLAEAVDPIKIYEYLYFGLTTVVTGIPHLATYPVTFLADGVQSFGDALHRAAKVDADLTLLDTFLAGATWRNRYLSLQNLTRERRLLSHLFIQTNSER
jgi:SAM-dependent methyltransferase